jgi:hypothetical protein
MNIVVNTTDGHSCILSFVTQRNSVYIAKLLKRVRATFISVSYMHSYRETEVIVMHGLVHGLYFAV